MSRGIVWQVGSGPGGPGRMTLKTRPPLAEAGGLGNPAVIVAGGVAGED